MGNSQDARLRSSPGVWEETLLELIARTSTDLPRDVEAALLDARSAEDQGNGRDALDAMIANAGLARERRQPICQDTGTILFWVEIPPGRLAQSVFREAAERAIVRATRDGLLRQNCVDTLTNRNTGNNLGSGSPVIHWAEREGTTAEVWLLLKGGGCENVGIQYSLPDPALDAGRDLEGVRRCALDAVFQAQGRGCSPGVLGVALGGDRATGYAESKRLLLRRIGERSAVPELAELERRLLAEANSLGIGPMGFGGRTTLLDVFVGCRARLPASYFISVSYMCWAYRRRQVKASLDGTPIEWS
ncbi:MAG: fumarate hydratase [Lentisphaeria bacterium]|nr:fumarate hydratase [Lentisphaeria bacterium]